MMKAGRFVGYFINNPVLDPHRSMFRAGIGAEQSCVTSTSTHAIAFRTCDDDRRPESGHRQVLRITLRQRPNEGLI
jgi:hypothetical protein